MLKADCDEILKRAVSDPPKYSAGRDPTEYVHEKINRITGKKIAETILWLYHLAATEEAHNVESSAKSSDEIMREAAEKLRMLESERPKSK
jgi:hypothetical protein